MPALRRKRRRFPSTAAAICAAKGGTPVLPPFSALLPPGISSRFKHSPDFFRYSIGIRASSSTDCQTTYRRRHACPARTGMHYHRRPFFRKKPRIGCPANLLENDFPPGYLFCQPFISQNLRIILTHNHRRRCGNDFIADARAHASRRFFAKSSTVDVPPAGYPTAPPPGPEMMLETSPPLMRAACMVSIQ